MQKRKQILLLPNIQSGMFSYAKGYILCLKAVKQSMQRHNFKAFQVIWKAKIAGASGGFAPFEPQPGRCPAPTKGA